MTKAITLDDLLALNDEIRGLVRAGIPLESGLCMFQADAPKRLKTLAQSICESLDRGKSLIDIVDDPSLPFPRLYRAVVAAGIRSGRLAAALEGLSNVARRASDLRGMVFISMVYPVVLLAIATVMLQFTATRTAPVMARTYETFGFERPAWYLFLESWQSMGTFLIVALWAVLAIGLWTGFRLSGRARALPGRGAYGLPTVFRMRQAERMASFAHILALLVENRVPLDEAVRLAAESSGDPRLVRSGEELAQRIRDGSPNAALSSGFPPLLGWLITRGTDADRLAGSLRQAAENYRRRARQMGYWLTVYFPILLSAIVGGLAVSFFGLMVMAPFYQLLCKLT